MLSLLWFGADRLVGGEEIDDLTPEASAEHLECFEGYVLRFVLDSVYGWAGYARSSCECVLGLFAP